MSKKSSQSVDGDEPTMSAKQHQEFLSALVRAAPSATEVSAANAQALIQNAGVLRATLRRALARPVCTRLEQRYTAQFKIEMIDTVAALANTELFRAQFPGVGTIQGEAAMLGWKRQLLHELRVGDSRTINTTIQPYFLWSPDLPWTTEEMLIQGESRRFRPATPPELIALCEARNTEPPKGVNEVTWATIEYNLVSLVPIEVLNDKYFVVRRAHAKPYWELEPERVKPWPRHFQAVFVRDD